MTWITAIRRAWLALIWERTAPLLAGPIAALVLYLIVAVFGVFERFGDPWRALILLTLIACAGVSVHRQWRQLVWPTRRDAERRVEADSGLTGRPYEALSDRAQFGSDGLWQAHQARMRDQLKDATTRRPKAAWAGLDPYGLRLSGAIVLIVGVFLVGDLARYRIEDAFSLKVLSAGGGQAIAEYWVEPPDYTGRPVQYLRASRSAEIPEGSIVSARITGLSRLPSVSGAPAEIEALPGDVQLITLTPEASGQIHLRAGAFRDQLDLSVIEDESPVVFIVADPEGDAQGRLSLEFTANDDYGVETYILEYAPIGEDGAPDGEFNFVVLAPGDVSPPDSEAVQSAIIDLSRSPLAGERAVVQLVALDGAGQRGASEPLYLTLPQRVFLDPLARAVAAERRHFITASSPYLDMPDGVSAAVLGGFMGEEPERRIERAPGEVQRLAMALDAVSDAPAAYFDDVIVYMGLRTAMREIRRARELVQLEHLDEDLWQIALRAELGSLADAEEALRAAQQALSDAMARGADNMEMSALFDAHEEAVSRYMQALAREAAEAGRFAESGGGSALNQDMLQELLDALREAQELGDTEGARRALQQLAELLANMQMTLTQGSGSEGEESPIEQALREALEELSEAIGEQRSIMEDTFESLREGEQAGENGTPEPGQADPSGQGQGQDQAQNDATSLSELAERQSLLGDALDEMGEALGEQGNEEAEGALDAARRAMGQAENALEGGDGDAALERQDRALSALREAASLAAEQMEQARTGQNGEDGQDPLGRSNGNGQPGQNTGIPSEAERQRAREILEELRRRAAERGRSSEELDYIERLLDRF